MMQWTALSITICLRSGKPKYCNGKLHNYFMFCPKYTYKFHNYSRTFKKTTWHHVVVQMAWPHSGGIFKSACSWLHVFISVPLIEIRWHFLKVNQGKLLSSYFPESWNILLTPKPPLCSFRQYGNLKYLIDNLFFRRAGQ